MASVKTSFIQSCLGFLNELDQVPSRMITQFYDKEADVLYVSFGKPQEATFTELTDEDIVVRKRGKEVVGITILHASKRYPSGP